MAPSSAFVSYSSSNLSDEPCPECSLTFLTKPKLCMGHHSPRNKGHFYQECNFKEYNDHPCCNFFRWQDDIPRALANVQDNDNMQQNFLSMPSHTFSAPSSQSSTPSCQHVSRQPCANMSCSERRHHTGHRNLQCVLNYCKTCCQKTSMSCPAPRHNEPVTPATNSITVTPCTPSTSTNSVSTLPAGFSFKHPVA
ncbi:hypothetical protein DFH08DRAFT_379461 [Mycena albidolilacea]|uniref:Uncharacterized protein n=1 Tax=Mycena albidolilacea TaxID=1033008 RepID=A0AAD7AKU8_9AGAR|nr:hypothetical protein DFH08DRAFT_379461 [Mycena albidolilacea]